MAEKRTQRDRILSYLRQHGTLTVREAITELDIMSAPKRIEELRKMGYIIPLDWVQTASGSRYGVYRLEEAANG